VFDLATSELFGNARNISLLAEEGTGSFASVGKVPRDALRDGPALSLTELLTAPVSRLASSFPEAKLAELATTLDLHSIRELAAWPPHRTACDLLGRVYNPVPSLELGEFDPGTPLDLLPATGQYPTERVQYEVLLFDSSSTAAGRKRGRCRRPGSWTCRSWAPLRRGTRCPRSAACSPTRSRGTRKGCRSGI
jgi:hypothetical protein